MERAPTLRDVAAAAGVHVSVVSRVLNGSPTLNVRPQTRDRIQAAAAALRYRPNVAARALKLASTGALGMLVPSLRNPVYTEIIRGAFDRAWERDFVVVLAEDRAETAAEEAYERLAQAGRIDGLLVAGVRPDSALALSGDEGRAPLVFVNRRHPDGVSVAMREEEAAALAVAHLRELGHRRVAHLAGPVGIDTADRRLAGYAEAVTGLPDSVVVRAGFDERSGYEAMRVLLERRSPPTGVFVSNINQGIGALAGARDVGFTVPDDVSVVAYDDDPISNYLTPALTGIRMPLHEMGRLAVDVLLDGTGSASREVIVPTAPELVVRASTAPARPK